MHRQDERRNIPHHVIKAIREEDTITLRAMGRKGGAVSARNRDIKKTVAIIYSQEIVDEFWQRDIEIHADICPID